MEDLKTLCDLQAEASVLSCILIEPDKAPYVMSELDEGDFSSKLNKTIYEAMSKISERGDPIDLTTVAGQLKESNKFSIDVSEHLGKVMDLVLSAENIKTYVSTVKKYSILRKTFIIASTLQSTIKSSKSIDAITSSLSEMMIVSASAMSKKSTAISDILDISLSHTKDIIDGNVTPNISYGWTIHDRMLKGMGPGHLIVVGARPGMGKTQYVINIARKLIAMNRSVYFKSYEMTSVEVVNRIINMNSRDGRYFSEEINKKKEDIDVEWVFSVYNDTYSQVMGKNLNIDEIASDDTVRFKSRLMQKKMEGVLDLGIVDYMQLIPKNKSQMQHSDPMAQISRELKLAAKEAEVPVIALAQLNRNATTRTNKRPSLEDLRESGAIEQDADVVILLHRDDYYQDECDSRGVLEIIIAKNRHGATGVIKMMYDRRLGLMGEIDERYGQD